jgi:hypothetical protein
MEILPIKHDLKLAYIASFVVAFVMTVASVAGIVSSSTVYPAIESKLLPLFVGQDVLNIVVGLPMLLGAMWFTSRGNLGGLLLWPGALFYVVYDYGYYILGAPFNVFFLSYLALVTLSGYTMVGIIASIDRDALRDRLAPGVPHRMAGGFLAGIALLFTALWTSITISALISKETLDLVVRTVLIMDLSIQLPALLTGGILLWRRQALGYTCAAGLILQAGVYLTGLSIITLIQEILLNLPVDPIAVVPGFVVGAICFYLLLYFVRGNGLEQRTLESTLKVSESVLVEEKVSHRR